MSGAPRIARGSRLRAWEDHRAPTPESYGFGCRGKVRFTSKRKANGWRRVVLKKHGGDPARLGAYHCRICHGWHLGNSRWRGPPLAVPAPTADSPITAPARPAGRKAANDMGEAPRTRPPTGGSNGSNGTSAQHAAPIDLIPAPVGMDPRTRSEIAEQIRIAREFPRDIKAALKLAEELALLDDETAASCYYTLKRRDSESGENKPIEGPSVRLAEIVVMAWGHLFVAAGQSGLTERFVTARGAVWDMQTNNRWMFDTTRRITRRDGKTYSDDMIATTSNAAASIALRNGVFKVVPSPFWRPIYLKCRETAMGSPEHLQKNWAKALAYFETELKVTEGHVLAWLDIRSAKEVQRVHVGRLRGLVTAIKDGDTTVEEAFADVQIVQMPQRESATSPQAAAVPVADPQPEPVRPGLYLTRLLKRENSKQQPYWTMQFNSGQQAITFSTTWGTKLEEWDMAGKTGAPVALDQLSTHKNGEWTYLDDVKPVDGARA